MKTKAKTTVHIRWMIRRDECEFLEIENAAFEYPWSIETLRQALRNRNCIGMVAEYDENVVGYMVYELHSDKLFLLSMAVHPDHHHQGVATQMIDKLIGKLSKQRRHSIETEIRESNLDAQLFFKAMGFRATGIQWGWYQDTAEDAYRFEFRLGEK